MPPYRLGLFPLNVVLFPGTPLPLHIFEPRYRQLLKDCLGGSRKFGLTPPGGTGEAPEPGTVGCVAEVRANEQLPDGRSNVMVVGGTRFIVREVVPGAAPYHVGVVEEFDELPGTLPSTEQLDELRTLFLRYFGTLRQLSDADPADEPALPNGPVALSFAIAAAIECDVTLKQRLLATRSTEERVGMLLRILPPLSASVDSALRVHRRARTNGKGGAHPVLPTDL
jgi:Lon protease-like protein